MRIVWVSPWFGNYRIPVYEHLNRLTDGDFHIICSKENTRDLVRQKLKATLGNHAVIMEGEQRSTFGSEESDFANSALVIKKQPGLYNAIKKTNPDVLIVEGFGSWSPAGIKYTLLHRKKLCMFYERTFHVERNSPWYRTLYRKIVGMAVNAFLVNGTLTNEYIRKGLGFKSTFIQQGCMSADSFGLAEAVARVTEEEKKELYAQLNLQKGLTYLYVGQMVQRKGIKELLSAWSKHQLIFPDDNLIVIGQGVLWEELKGHYQGKGNIHLLGAINYDKIHQYYVLCDVFVMPTLEDNWCLVVPEAMACGKPIACSVYNGGYVELVKDGENGWTFDPLKEGDILQVLERFHHADLKKMGITSKLIESDFTPDKTAQRIFDTCKKVVAGQV